MVGAFPGSKEEYVHDKVERQAGAQSEEDLKAILGVQFFFFFFHEKPLYSFDPERTCSDFFKTYFGFFVENRLERMARYILCHLTPSALC